MKKVITILLAASILVMGLSACQNDATGTVAVPTAAPSAVPQSGDATVAIAPPSIALIVSNASDKSFGESAANGLKIVSERYGCKTNIVEFGNDETKILPTLEDLTGEYDIIISVGFKTMEYVETVAAKNPEQKYALLDKRVQYDDGKNANVYSADYVGSEGAFLSGAMAAMVSTSAAMPNSNPEKMIGFVGGMDMTLINDFALGYIQGAQYIDPDMKVVTAYTASWTDAAKGKEIAKTMLDAGCDVIFNGAGGAGLGALDACKEASRYAIGTDSDQALLFQDDPVKANLILTSQLKSLDQNIIRLVEQYMAGENVFGKGETLGVREGIIKLAQNEYYMNNVSQEIRDAMDVLTQKLISGEIKVESAYGMDEASIKQRINDARP